MIIHPPQSFLYSAQGVRVEVEIGGLQSWTDLAELDAVLAPLSLASAKKLSTDELVQDDMIADERCKVAFAAVQVRPPEENLPESTGCGTVHF